MCGGDVAAKRGMASVCVESPGTSGQVIVSTFTSARQSEPDRQLSHVSLIAALQQRSGQEGFLEVGFAARNYLMLKCS